MDDHRKAQSDSGSTSSDEEDLLKEDSEGWEDAEADEETTTVKAFFSDAVFPDALSMVQDCATTTGIDFLKLQKTYDLDFYGSIKLVNYLRSEALAGNNKPSVSSKATFEDDKYLQPVLEDDALLFCLDDLIDANGSREQTSQDHQQDESSDARIRALEEELSQLRVQYSEYRSTVEKNLDQRWADTEATPSTAVTRKDIDDQIDKDYEQGYFDSYSYNEIHQTMLQDTIRTDAYRDFIYANKRLFAGKTVLDVGCGTGILSMFCAKAGAARVISVDNSDIIEKAKINVAINGLTDTITCVRGKVEEITLPDGLEKVDIIVSEWMGYCLLFEAMLDSVIYARDKYLKPDGLMVPSHCTLQVAAIEDQQYMADNVTFWNDVYGFNMVAMMEKIYDDVLVRYPKKESIVGRSPDELPFKILDLHTVKVEDLQFSEPFSVTLSGEVESLDSWCIWFDTLFLTSRDTPPSAKLLQGRHAGDKEGDGVVTFTTGPFGRETHWGCGTLMIDRSKKAASALNQGQRIEGEISFVKDEKAKRGLAIGITWNAQDAPEKGNQRWNMK